MFTAVPAVPTVPSIVNVCVVSGTLRTLLQVITILSLVSHEFWPEMTRVNEGARAGAVTHGLRGGQCALPSVLG